MHDLIVKKLRCEYRNNPVGIDVVKPRLSWQLAASGRNVKQAAYQIQVSTDNTGAFTGPLVWDSGKIISDRSVHVEYEGDQLRSSTQYSYRVRVWSSLDEESVWSETAYWITGLLSSDEWKAQWISGMYGQPTEQSSHQTCCVKHLILPLKLNQP
ncbi:hypothetical protein [Paenibacillus radicis (ex Xue et al. 2023)]|uniref:Alfa-L-rhamnosidase n=1 Tax=Paenibacillus radicis (ex Xue et al. 2023) TaxID=2972489 RepID=A0ABT1YNB3_9BACL|nr:hypothetical protein [Paenibacillus radicis (ex Xue et al. 2023)]MCR8634651.1 hypothetical protein [Paenibacillus radicis (ex Xue et al. 2023)]